MIREFWNDSVRAVSVGFDTSRTVAKVLVAGTFCWLGVMILQTWFIWLGIIAVVGIVLVLEYSLRVWYLIHDHMHPPEVATSVPTFNQDVPDRPATPCADAQGRIAKDGLDGYDVNTMAERIMQKACIRKTPNLRPRWLHFPAICRAMPRLASVTDDIRTMLAR